VKAWVEGDRRPHWGNVDIIGMARPVVRGQTLIIENLNSPVLRVMVREWSKDGDPPPLPIDAFEVEDFPGQASGKRKPK